MAEHTDYLLETHYEDTICQKECQEFAEKMGDKLDVKVDQSICLHVMHQIVLPNYNLSQQDELKPLKNIKHEDTAYRNHNRVNKPQYRKFILQVCAAVARHTHELSNNLVLAKPDGLDEAKYAQELKDLGTVIPKMLKLSFVGKDFEHVLHNCSEKDYQAVKLKVQKQAIKPFQFICDFDEYPQDKRDLCFQLGMDQHLTATIAQERITNILRLVFRVIWLAVLPVPKNEFGVNEPKVFCYLYHCGKFIFCCDYDDFETKFSFEEEIKQLERVYRLGNILDDVEENENGG